MTTTSVLTSVSPLRKYSYFGGALILLAILFSFYPCFSNGFVSIDDAPMLYNNEKIFSLSLPNAIGYFTSLHRGLYHPLVLLSYAVEFHFFGLNPFIYHVTNVGFHFLNSLLVFGCFYLLLRKHLVALVIASLFAVHPLRVESVAWVAERKDVLFAFFYLMAMWFYLTYLGTNKRNSYWASFAAFVFSLLSKPMAVSLPFVLILFDYMQKEKLSKQDIKEKVPFILAMLCFPVVALIGQRSFLNADHISLTGLGSNLLEANYTFLLSLYKSFAPIHLSLHYPRYVKDGVLLKGYLWYSPLISSLVVAAAIYSLKYSKKVAYGMIFFIITLLPVSNIIPFGLGIPGDRLTYIPQLGLLYIFGSAVAWLYGTREKNVTLLQMIAGVLIAAVIFLCGLLTYQRCTQWKNSFLLFSDVVAKYPEARTSKLAYAVLADIYAQHGDTVKAREYLQKSISLDGPEKSYSLDARLNLLEGNKEKALNAFETALLQNPRIFYLDLQTVQLCAALGHLDDALRLSEKALERKPEYSWLLYRERGNIFLNRGEFDKAASEYSRAIDLNPRDDNSYLRRGIACKNLHENVESRDDMAKAIFYGSRNPNSIFNAQRRSSKENQMSQGFDLLAGW